MFGVEASTKLRTRKRDKMSAYKDQNQGHAFVYNTHKTASIMRNEAKKAALSRSKNSLDRLQVLNEKLTKMLEELQEITKEKSWKRKRS